MFCVHVAPPPETIGIADVRLLVRLCDIRQPTERGRRARTQAAWSFVSRVSRRRSAPVQVLPMSAVFRTFRSFGARSTRMRNPRVCQNTEPAKDRSTGHGTPDRTGPLTSTL